MWRFAIASLLSLVPLQSCSRVCEQVTSIDQQCRSRDEAVDSEVQQRLSIVLWVACTAERRAPASPEVLWRHVEIGTNGRHFRGFGNGSVDTFKFGVNRREKGLRKYPGANVLTLMPAPGGARSTASCSVRDIAAAFEASIARSSA